jgi:nucleoside-diphosphate-sugar epimerase
MKMLVTGAGGFIGAAVVAEALRSGYEVVGTIRPGGSERRLAAFKSHFHLVRIDLRDLARVDTMMSEFRPGVVVHAAWSGVGNTNRSDRLQISDNIESSCRLLEAAAVHGASRFIGIGSQGEYGLFDRKISEDDLPRPTSLYGAAKLAVHCLTRQLAAQAGLSYAWVRIFSTYGPGDNPHWLIPVLIDQMLDGHRPRTTLGEQLWDYLFIDDLAKAVISIAVRSAAQGVFNLGSGRPIRIRAVVEKVRDLIAPELELVFGEIPYGPDQVRHMEANIDRLRAMTEWRPSTSIDDGLAATVRWHRDQRAAGSSGLVG